MSFFTFEDQEVYYKIKGQGTPLLMLAGNTASSKLFIPVLKRYCKNYQVILMDYPGHGKSGRLTEFAHDFWYYNARVCLALLDELKIPKVAVLGVSGGAMVGINLSLEHPERVSHLIADSFVGESLSEEFIKILQADREKAKKSFGGRVFWYTLHGLGWQRIIEEDTRMITEFYKAGLPFYHKSVSELKVPTLLTGSMEDKFYENMIEGYERMKLQSKYIEIYMFERGKHPAILSNPRGFYRLVSEVLGNPV